MKYLHCLIGHNVLYFQFRPTLLTNVWNLKQFSAKNLIILVNFGLKSAIFNNLVLGPVHVIWAEVISVTEKHFDKFTSEISPCYEIIRKVVLRSYGTKSSIGRVPRSRLLTGEISVTKIISIPYEHNFPA